MKAGLIDKNDFSQSKVIPWLGLVCILFAFIFAVVRLHPQNLFGLTEDDSIYFSSAKGLAEGKGYVLASFPGTPAATKYPAFYPWLLSWVWRFDPSFPQNLKAAIAVNTAFGALFVVGSFVFFRRSHLISDPEAVFLAGCCALHPLVIFYSGSVLSEVPFAALVLMALLLAESMIEKGGNDWSALACGVVVGFSLLTRAFAVPIAAGIVLSAMARRSWRQLVIFCGSVFPFFVSLCWKTVFPKLPVSPASGFAAAAPGWTHTWTYYTSYINVWKEGVPTLSIFLSIIENNTRLLLSAPASYFIKLPAVGATVQGMVVLAVSGATIVGLIREVRQRGIRPFHLALPLYAVLVLVWSYPVAGRFLLPFLPVFAAGLWIEGKHLAGTIRTSLLEYRPAPEKALAVTFGFLLSLFAAGVAHTYVANWNAATLLSKQRGTLLDEKRGAYSWIYRSTDPGTRIIAYEDASVYLYADRPASRPFTFTMAEFYDSPRLHNDIDGHMIDVPLAIGAKYWISSEDDYGFEWPEARRQGLEERQKLEDALPVAYRSPQGKVKVYSLACLQSPHDIGCESMSRLLEAHFELDGKGITEMRKR